MRLSFSHSNFSGFLEFIFCYSCLFLMLFFFIREIFYGWCLRYLHSSGASFVFLFLFLHLGRAISCFSRKGSWVQQSGIESLGLTAISWISNRLLQSLGYSQSCWSSYRRITGLSLTFPRLTVNRQAQENTIKSLVTAWRRQTCDSQKMERES